METTVDRLRLEEAELMKQLDDIRAAIRVLGRLPADNSEASSGTVPSSVGTVPSSAPLAQKSSLGDSGAINLDELVLPAGVRKPNNTLITDIRNVVERLGDQEFTVNHIVAALQQTGKGVDAKHYRNRVSMTMKKLTEESYLERSHKGAGNEPHRYRRAKPVINQASVSLVSNK